MVSEALSFIVLVATVYLFWSRYREARVSRRQPDGSATAFNGRLSAAREIFETLVLAAAVFLLVRTFVLNFQVEGMSMQPSLANGDMLLVNPNAYGSVDAGDFIDWIPWIGEQEWVTVVDLGRPQRGDVIVFTPPEPSEQKPFIKRVIGLPGDTVTISDGSVFVNGNPLAEPYLEGATTPCNQVANCVDVNVPEGSVFVLGDNRGNSEDSRFFGVLPQERIIGRALLIYWPIGDIGTNP